MFVTFFPIHYFWMLEENKPIFSNITDFNHLNHPHPPSPPPAGNKYLVTYFFLKNSILTRTFFPNKPRPKQKKKKQWKKNRTILKKSKVHKSIGYAMIF